MSVDCTAYPGLSDLSDFARDDSADESPPVFRGSHEVVLNYNLLQPTFEDYIAYGPLQRRWPGTTFYLSFLRLLM